LAVSTPAVEVDFTTWRKTRRRKRRRKKKKKKKKKKKIISKSSHTIRFPSNHHLIKMIKSIYTIPSSSSPSY